MAVVRFQNVSKSFPHSTSRLLLRHHLVGWFSDGKMQPFFALKNVSFELGHGESLAIIGSNGAGKSTLLSLVAGLAKPNAGTVEVNGRVAALLELGSGFHPDLTGAENLMLNASLLGLDRKTTIRLFDKIVDFSGVDEFINEPLRTFSTGMVMRLAFSVAINTNPDLLLVDEVLAVGDSAFQAKCIEALAEMRRGGRSMLAVSHSAASIESLCDRAIWLDHGEVVMDGEVRAVLEAYEGRSALGAKV
ncbi:MAG: ABC transporter ATP-binding protein [Bryobacteraceae bacterium]